MSDYAELKERLSAGWNTWNTRSVLSHVMLPECFAVNFALKDYSDGSYLKEAFIGKHGDADARVRPGIRTYDGTYTDLTLTWKSITLRIESATCEGDLVALVTPQQIGCKAPALVVEPGVLWNRAGFVRRDGDELIGCLPEREVRVTATRQCVDDPYVQMQSPYLALALDQPVGVCAGRRRSLAEISEIVARGRAKREGISRPYGELAEVYDAMQTCLAWDTIYDPLHDRVVSPVSRDWSCGAGGYILFCWDTYFAALMASIDNRDLAYANAIEITREGVQLGFVPNAASATGFVTRDRSQPPVGSVVVELLFRKFGDRWLLEEVFDGLLSWNRWWNEHRRSASGLLAWGSDFYEPVVGNYWERTGVGEAFGAVLESGLDNSPLYDGIGFDKESRLLQVADVGLNGLYVADCRALARIAEALGRSAAAAELDARAVEYASLLGTLWDDAAGIFLNRRTDDGEFVRRLAPTNFYPLLGGAATPDQARRMIEEHFYDPREFWGDWILPSIARSDPAYADQDYWRGRIWAPMNLLVYLGMRNYDLAGARADLAGRSAQLLLMEWRESGHVHENYNADTGRGCDGANSDPFYHWGGLLSLISLIEAGYLDNGSQNES